MESISYSFSVRGGLEQVGALLLDPAVVTRCLPGAALTRTQGGTFTGSFLAELSNTSLTYHGNGSLTVDGGTGAIVLAATGRDRRDGHTAAVRVAATLMAEGPTRTSVHTESTFDLEGLRESLLGEPLRQAVADAADTFAAKLAARLRSARARPGPQADLDPADPMLPGWLFVDQGGRDPDLNNTAPVFVSYNQKDEDTVQILIEDLRFAGVPIWRDSDMDGGDAWWSEILRRIREAPVFVQAISEMSQESEACHIEYTYARKLGIPVLPVQVGDADLHISPYGQRQLIDYRDAGRRGAIRLVAALMRSTMRRGPLPADLPEEPAAPGGYLLGIAAELHVDKLDLDAQLTIVHSLAGRLERATPLETRRIRTLLKRLVDRSDAMYQPAKLAEQLLRRP